MIKKRSDFYGKLLMMLFCTLTIFVFASVVSAQAVTFRGTMMQTGGQYLTTADFNGDGKIDIAAVGLNLEIYLGGGDGSFQKGAAYPVVTPGGAASAMNVVKGDFNGDGKTDLAIAIDAAYKIAVFLGVGDGTFQPVERFSTGSNASPDSMVAADFNRDGKLDLMTTDGLVCLSGCVNSQTVAVFDGNGDGTFAAPRRIVVGTGMSKATVGEFNGDGIADVAITSGIGGRVFILLNNGDGTFRQMPDVVTVAATDNTDVAVGDFNSDSIQDLAVAADGESKVGIFLGRGDGTFNAATLITDSFQHRGATLTVGDVNRDGRLDIVVGLTACCAGSTTAGMYGILYGNGNGTFQAMTRYFQPVNGRVNLSGWNPVLADFNADGKLDLAGQYATTMGGTFAGIFTATNTTGVAPARFALGSMTVAPTSVVGGETALINLALTPNAVAPTGLTTFTVTSSDSSIAVPKTNTTSTPLGIVGGMTNIRFQVQTSQVTTARTVTITASNSTLGSRSLNLTITPPNTPLSVGSIQMQPRGVFGGDDTTGVVTLATGHVAPAGGAFVTLSNDNPNLVSTPSSVTIPAGQTSASFPVQTDTTGVTTVVNVGASYGGVTKTTDLTVAAPSQNISISSVTLSPSTVVGGGSIGVRITVTLASGSPLEGARIMLSSSNPAIVPVPRVIRTNFEGQTSAFADVAPTTVSAPTQVTITATYGSSTQSEVLTVMPPPNNAPAITNLLLNPASVVGGSSSQGTIALSAAASAPTTITLSSSSAVASVPSSVTVPAGATGVNFPVNTISISSPVTSTITATQNGISLSATLTVTPTQAASDTVSISRAEYDSRNRSLRVEASSNRSNAVLQAFVTSSGQLIGTLSNNGGKYSGQFTVNVNPQNITVRSSFGGQASRAITLK
ncbi:MAG TPA: FG-GAP-like repeat-containing protein [Pyrinomonadaceae bacterium]